LRYNPLAAATTVLCAATIVTTVAATAAVIAAAADENEKDDNPATAAIAEKAVTHIRFPPFLFTVHHIPKDSFVLLIFDF